MKAEIISIGDELLIGQTINTNGSWIAESLHKSGVETRQITVVSDSREEILRSLSEAQKRADLIITTGGLGPTDDDKTVETLCEFFDTKIIEHPEVLEDIKIFFLKRGMIITDTNRKQALVPEKCKVLRNLNGTAPGLWFEENNKIFISLPGVPYELKSLMTDYVVPHLNKINTKNYIIHRTMLTHGIGESFLADKLKNWEQNISPSINLAYLPSPGIVKLRLSGKGKDYRKISNEIDKNFESLKNIITEYIFGEGDDTLQGITGKLLRDKRATVSLAESCTGGMISQLLTSISGSSQYYTGGIVAYDNSIKINRLGVESSLIEKYGAVSKEVAESMAAGIRKIMQTDYGLATTGIAGPTGGTASKPVGLVWIALATKDKVISKKFLFGDNRERNIIRTSLAALNLLRLYVLSDSKKISKDKKR